MATTEQQEGAGTIAPPPVVARLMFPDDANIAGNVHGGTILQLMEQAGMIAATRFLNEKSSDDDDEQQQQRGDTNGGDTNKRLFFAALQRFETMSFHKPIYIGNVASVTARVVFTSERTVLLKVIVTAEDLAKGSTCTTNSGLLWYTCWTRKNKDDDSDDSQPGGGGGGYSLVPIPRQVVVSPEESGGRSSRRVGFDEYQKAKSMYEKRKKRSSTNLSTTNGDNTASEDTVDEDEYEAFVASNPATNAKTPSSSKQRLCQMVLPGDCGTDSEIALGGFVMKLMDNAAGCVAYRHCLRNVVTISINAMDFTSFVRLGHLVTIDAKIVYCSNKTMEIGVTASTESPDDINNLNNNNNSGVDVVVVAKAMFTFVALDSQTRRPIGVPPLRLETGDELKQAFEAKQAYEQAKRERAK